jgi:hypothetical protein
MFQSSDNISYVEACSVKSLYQKEFYAKSKNNHSIKIKQEINVSNPTYNSNYPSINTQTPLPISSSNHPLEISITPLLQNKIIAT